MLLVLMGAGLALGAPVNEGALRALVQDVAVPVRAAVSARTTDFEVSSVGSGSPELLLWFGAQRPDSAELVRRRELVVELAKRITPGTGRVHFVVDLGPGDGLADGARFESDFPCMQGPDAAGESVDESMRLRRADSRALAGYLLANPQLVGVLREGAAGEPLMAIAKNSFGEFCYRGLGLVSHQFSVPVATETRSAQDLECEALLQRLDSARIQISAQMNGASRLGGELWQVDVALGAPDLARARPDSFRIYPQTRFQMAIEDLEREADAPAAKLIEVAWRGAGQTDFQRLTLRDGQFRFPSGGIPVGASLRLIMQVPGSAPSLDGTPEGQHALTKLRVSLDGGHAGKADCDLDLVVGPPVTVGE